MAGLTAPGNRVHSNSHPLPPVRVPRLNRDSGGAGIQRSGKARTQINLTRGVRAVASLEALKGVLVVVAGFGLLSLVHHDLQTVAESLVRLSHLNPARHYPQVFIEAAANLNDSRLRLLAALAFLYACARFVEAYGLWRVRAWAEWFAIVSGGIYLPVEVFELLKHATILKGVVLLVNVAIVAYLIFYRWFSRQMNQKATNLPRGKA